MAGGFPLTKPVELVNAAADLDLVYGPYINMEDALSVLNILGKPGRQFTLQDPVTKVVTWYMFQGVGKQPTKATVDLISIDNTLNIEENRISSNVTEYIQTEEIIVDENTSFPISIVFDVNYTSLNLVVVNGFPIPKEFYKLVSGGVSILDYTKAIPTMAVDKLYITLLGNYFINE